MCDPCKEKKTPLVFPSIEATKKRVVHEFKKIYQNRRKSQRKDVTVKVESGVESDATMYLSSDEETETDTDNDDNMSLAD